MPQPYKTTLEFTEATLPDALRREHSTKAGVWGLVRVVEGELWLRFDDGRSQLLGTGTAGVIRPQEVHWVEPAGAMRMRVEFYDERPQLS